MQEVKRWCKREDVKSRRSVGESVGEVLFGLSSGRQ